MTELQPETPKRKMWSFSRRPTGDDICALIMNNDLYKYSMDIQWAYDQDNPRTGAVCYIVTFERRL